MGALGDQRARALLDGSDCVISLGVLRFDTNTGFWTDRIDPSSPDRRRARPAPGPPPPLRPGADRPGGQRARRPPARRLAGPSPGSITAPSRSPSLPRPGAALEGRRHHRRPARARSIQVQLRGRRRRLLVHRPGTAGRRLPRPGLLRVDGLRRARGAGRRRGRPLAEAVRPGRRRRLPDDRDRAGDDGRPGAPADRPAAEQQLLRDARGPRRPSALITTVAPGTTWPSPGPSASPPSGPRPPPSSTPPSPGPRPPRGLT